MNTMRIEAAAVDNDSIRRYDRASIRAFMEECRPLLAEGRVLDFGAGKQPYRDCVGGEYVPFDKGDDRIEGPFSAIICNQVWQYIEDLPEWLDAAREQLLEPGGRLIATYATNWAEVEPEDLSRLTRWGAEHFIRRAGFEIERNERRLEINLSGFVIPIGYGIVARAIE